MRTLRIDLETFSPADLPKCGAHRYVDTEGFEILLFGYAYDSEPVVVIDLACGEEIPADVLADIENPKVRKTAFNAAFEICCLSKYLGRPLDPAQWACTQVQSLYMGFPAALAQVGKAMQLTQEQQKDAGGDALIRYFTRVCKPTKSNGARTRNLPKHDLEKWKLFIDYCRQDVESERVIANKLAKFPLPALEQRLWVLDQVMNNNGIRVDRALIEAAIECDEIFFDRLTAEAIELTGISNPNSREQLLGWLQEAESDNSITDLTKKEVPKLLEATESAVVRRVLQIRQELAKTSTTKYLAMSRAICSDDRIRGLTQFYGANRTGRWAGRLVQVQNLPRNELKDLDLARTLVKERKYDLLETLFGNVPDTLSQLIRTSFISDEGTRFVVVDFSAIEARVIAWMANCEWRLDVFKTHGKIYEASAEQMFNLPAGSVDKKSPYRQKGKIAELALGYAGGAGALETMGALDMGLSRDELEPIKVAWRAANKDIVDLWYACERASLAAVAQRKSVDVAIAGGASSVTFEYASGMLFIKLPSGRKLSYVQPKIAEEDIIHPEKGYVIARAGSLIYQSMDQKTRRWGLATTYGGKLVENITQAVARDCLREAMFALEDEGYSQITTVHDEIIMEEPFGTHRNVRHAEEIMGRPIHWAPGLPLRGDGFETNYYMKEID